MLPKFELSLPEQTEFLRKRAFFILKILIDLFLHLKIPQIFGEDKNGQNMATYQAWANPEKFSAIPENYMWTITFEKYLQTFKYG